MTGALGLGGGTGSVYADDTGAFLESSKDGENSRKIIVERPSAAAPLSDAAKLITKSNGKTSEYPLFGKHNLPCAAQIKYGTYVGDGGHGPSAPNVLSAGFDIKIVIIYYNYLYEQVHHSPLWRSDTIIAYKNGEYGELRFDWSVPTHVSYYHQRDSAYDYTSDAKSQWNTSGVTYHYILIG
jgi:hypothetical protein